MKSKLPFLKKKRSEDEEYDENDEDTNSSQQDDATDSTDISDMDEEAAENNSLIHKLKSKIKSLQKKKGTVESSEQEGEEGEDDEAAKKKKRSKILQIVIGTGLVVFLASDYIFPPEQEAPVPQLKPRPRPQKPANGNAGTATDPGATEAPAETPAAETPATETADSPVAETPEDTTATEAPAESPGDTAGTEAPSETPVDTVTTETPDETTTVETPSESPVDVSSTETPADTSPETENTDIATDSSNDLSGEQGLGEPTVDPGAVSNADSIDGTMPGTEDNLTDQILEDLEKQAKSTETPKPRTEYVAPPDYEYRGRGLVYNCKGKHWACVDAPSYKACEDNSASNQYLKKPVECYPFNVYETARGCENMQNRMVSSSAKTDFCSE